MDEYHLLGGTGYGMSDDGGTRLVDDSTGMMGGMNYGRPNPSLASQGMGPGGMVSSHVAGPHQNPNSVMTGMVPQPSMQQQHSANHMNTASNMMAYHQMTAQHGYQQSEVPQKLQHYGGYGGPQGMGMANNQFPSSSRLQQMAEPSLTPASSHGAQQQGSQSLAPMAPYQQQQPNMMGAGGAATAGQYSQRPQLGPAANVHMTSNQYPGSYPVPQQQQAQQQQQPPPQHQPQMAPANEVWQSSMMHSPQHHRPYASQGPSYSQHSQPAPMSPVSMQVPRPATPNQNQFVGGGPEYGVHPSVQTNAPQRPPYYSSQNGMHVSQTPSHIPASQSDPLLASYSSQGQQFAPASSQALGARPSQSAANAMPHSSNQMMAGVASNRTMQRVGYGSPHHHVNSGQHGAPVQQGSSPVRLPQYQCSTYSPNPPYSQPSGLNETPTPTRLSPYPQPTPVQAPGSPQYRPAYPPQATLSPRRPTPTPPTGSPMPPASHTPDRMGHPPNSSTPQSQGSYPSPGASHMSSPGQGLSPGGSTVTPSSSLQQLEQMVMPHVGGQKQSSAGAPSSASAGGSGLQSSVAGATYYSASAQTHGVSQPSLASYQQQTQTPPLQPPPQQPMPHQQYHPQMSPSVNQQGGLTPLGTHGPGNQPVQTSVGGLHHGTSLHNDTMGTTMQLPTSMSSYVSQGQAVRSSMGHDMGGYTQLQPPPPPPQQVNSPGGGPPTLTTLTPASQPYQPPPTSVYDIQQQLQHLYSLPQSAQNDQKISDLQDQLQYLQSQTTSPPGGCAAMPPAVNTQPPSSVYLAPAAPPSSSPQLSYAQQQYNQQAHFEPQLDQPHLQHDGMGGPMPVYGEAPPPQLTQLHEEGLSQDHESHGHMANSEGMVTLAPPPPSHPENGMMDDGVFTFTEDDIQDLPPMLRPVKRGKPKGKSTKPKKPPKSKKGAASAAGIGPPVGPPPAPLGDMDNMADVSDMPPSAVMGMPPITVPISDDTSLGMDEMPHLVPEENLDMPRCPPMQEMHPLDQMDPERIEMMGLAEPLPEKKPKKSKKRKTKEKDPNAPPKEPKPKKPKKPKAPKEPKERKEPRTPKKPKTPKQPKEPKVKHDQQQQQQQQPNEQHPLLHLIPDQQEQAPQQLDQDQLDQLPQVGSEAPQEERAEPKEAKEAGKEKPEKKEKRESKSKSSKSSREPRSKSTPKKKLPKLALKFKKKKRKRLGSSDQSDLEVTPPPSPEETEDGVQKRRSARNTKRKKYTDDIELVLSEDDTLDVDQDKLATGANRAVQVLNVNLEDTMVVERIMASRMLQREVEVEPSEETEGQPTTVEVEEFFVKYKNLSYIHCDWKTAEELEKGDRKIAPKIKRYKQKKDVMNNFFDFLEEDPYNPDYVEVDRILDVNEIVEVIEDEDEIPAEAAENKKAAENKTDQNAKGAKADDKTPSEPAAEAEPSPPSVKQEVEKEVEQPEVKEEAEHAEVKEEEEVREEPQEKEEPDQTANTSDDEKSDDNKPKDFDDSSQETIIDKEEDKEEEKEEKDQVLPPRDEEISDAPTIMEQETIQDPVIEEDKSEAIEEKVEIVCSKVNNLENQEQKPLTSVEEATDGACIRTEPVKSAPSPEPPAPVAEVKKGEKRTTRIVRHYLVKWRGLPYEDSTWELEEDVDRPKIEQFLRFREPPPREKWKVKKRPKPPEWTKLEVSPIYKGENTLREYQLEGLNWLTFCWYNGQNCILADEMGLGKTIQSIAFLNEVANYGIPGPYLVIAPLSTIGNWQREFETWTDLNVITYHGSSASRNMLQEYEMYYKNEKGERITEVYKFQVMITTFEIVLHDCLELREIPWRCVIIDEAHRLKNRNCKLLEGLRLLNMEHRVLLTGTPLQNNVEELFSLLNFLEPSRFASTEAFLEEFGDLKTENQVDKLKALLKPMMLRRLKEDVEKSLAPKEETIVEVELTNIQKKYYRAILERNFQFLTKGGTGTNMPNLMNTMMELRKCCIHPFLINGAEEQILLEYKAQHGETTDVSLNAMISSSGKLVLIDKLLPRLRADGHRVLIFSQMVRCLDILEDYLVHRRYPYERIDGRVRGNLRQAAIDRFCKPDSDRFVFLLCTRAGGLGINLTAADTVIIFDSDWNPQNDLQAQARCHRIGQSKAVKVYRLICRNTYEREMFDKASLKLGLDKAVLQSMNASKENLGVSHQLSKKEIEDLLRKGAYGALMEDDNAGDKFCEEDIDQILSRRTHVITLEGGTKGSTFAKATFSASNTADIEVDDPNFWEKWAKRANLDVDELKNKNELIVQEPRRRTQTKRFGAEDSMLDLSDLESSDEDDESISARTRGGRRSSKGTLGIPRSRNRNRKNAGFEKDRGEEILEDVAPGNWTRAECFKVEKGLLTFGWGRWEECLALGNFKRNFTMKDIEDISRIVLLYCLQNYKGDEKIKGFIWDLIAPTEDGETKIHKNHSGIPGNDYLGGTSGLSAPVPRGRKGKKLKKDSKQTSCEEDDTLADWAKEEKYNTDVLLNDEGYKRHLHRHANKVLLRVRLLYYLKHEVIGDLHDQVVSHVPASEIPLPTPIADGEPPAPWWDQEADKSLLVGVYKHGFERYNVMRQDPALCFFARCGPPDGAALLAEINIFSRNDDEMDDKTSQKDKTEEKDEKDDKPDKDDLDELEEPVSPAPSEKDPSTISASTAAAQPAPPPPPSSAAPSNEAGAAGTPELTAPEHCLDGDFWNTLYNNLCQKGEQGKFPFPTVCDLNTRLRRIITGYQRSFKKEEIKLAQKARRMERREKFEAAIKERELKKRELQQRRWSRREEADFYRTISSFGVEFNHEKQQYDWSRFRAIGRLERKFDDTLTEYYKAFYAMCKRVCGRKLTEEEEQFPLIVEPISEERATRCLQRIDLLNKIREEILSHPQLDERLKLCQSSMDLPDWWQCGKHDKDLLIGAARHGLSRMDYHLLHDPDLSFKDVLKMKPAANYPSTGGCGSQWSTPAGGASPVIPFTLGGDEKDTIINSETDEKPNVKPLPDSFRALTPTERKDEKTEDEAVVSETESKPLAQEKISHDATTVKKEEEDGEETEPETKPDILVDVPKETIDADKETETEVKKEVVEAENEHEELMLVMEEEEEEKKEPKLPLVEEDVTVEPMEVDAEEEKSADAKEEEREETAMECDEVDEEKADTSGKEESKEIKSVETVLADADLEEQDNTMLQEGTKVKLVSEGEEGSKEMNMNSNPLVVEQKPDTGLIKQEDDEKSDVQSKPDDTMDTASQNDELMSQESFNLEYEGGEPTVAQLLAHSARNPIRWPKDKVLQIRLEHVCHAIEKNEWPVLRHTFLPSFPVVTTPSIGASVVSTTSTTPAPLESSPRPASPVPSTSSQGASGEATPQATPEHTPRREAATPQEVPISPLPEYQAPSTGSPVFMVVSPHLHVNTPDTNEGGKVPRRRRRRRRAEIEAERAKLRALLSQNIQQQVQQFMPPPPSIVSTPLRASLREDHSYSDEKAPPQPATVTSVTQIVGSSAPPPAHQNSAPRVSTTLGSLDLRVKPALSLPLPSVIPPPPPPPPPAVPPAPPTDMTANSPSSPMDLSSSSTPTSSCAVVESPVPTVTTTTAAPSMMSDPSPNPSLTRNQTSPSSSLLNGAVRGRGGRGRGRGRLGGGSRIDALALNLQARKQQQLLQQQQQQQEGREESSAKPQVEREHTKHPLGLANIEETDSLSRLSRKQSPKPDESRLLRSRTSTAATTLPSWSTTSHHRTSSSSKHAENLMSSKHAESLLSSRLPTANTCLVRSLAHKNENDLESFQNLCHPAQARSGSTEAQSISAHFLYKRLNSRCEDTSWSPLSMPHGIDIMKLGLKPEESTPNPSSLVEQAAAIRQDLKKWLEDHPEVVASNPTLAAAAAAAMAFNPMPSMPPNTELLELPEGRRRGRRPRVDPSKLDLGAITGEENVSVINRLTGKKITGSKAPPLKHLAEWLEKNPMFDVDPKWGPVVREKFASSSHSFAAASLGPHSLQPKPAADRSFRGNLPDTMRKRIVSPSEKRGRRTAASLLASAHQSMNSPSAAAAAAAASSMMSSFPPTSGLGPLNFANAGMLSGFPGMKFFVDPSKGGSGPSTTSTPAPGSAASAPLFFPFGGLAGMGLASPLFGFPSFNLQGLQGSNPLSNPGVGSSEKDGDHGPEKSKSSEKNLPSGSSSSSRTKSSSSSSVNPLMGASSTASSVASTSSATSLANASLPFLYPAPGLLYNPLGLSSFALTPNMSTSFASLAQAGLVNGLGGLGSTTSNTTVSSSSLIMSSSGVALTTSTPTTKSSLPPTSSSTIPAMLSSSSISTSALAGGGSGPSGGSSGGGTGSGGQTSLLAGQESDDESLKSLMGNDEDDDDDLNGDLDDNPESAADKDDSDLDEELQRLKTDSDLITATTRRDAGNSSGGASLTHKLTAESSVLLTNSKLHKGGGGLLSKGDKMTTSCSTASSLKVVSDTSTSQTTSPGDKENPS